MFNSLLTSFKQHLLRSHLGSVSRKLYAADVARFLRSLGEPSLDQLTSPQVYREYLSSLDNAPLAKRTVASLRQFGAFFATTHSLPDPTQNLTLSPLAPLSQDLSPHHKYIKSFSEYLNHDHLSPLTIKSYKSDIQRFLKWSELHLPGSKLSALLRTENQQKYLLHLADSSSAIASTIERKGRSLMRFADWHALHYGVAYSPDKSGVSPAHTPPQPLPLESSLSLVEADLTPSSNAHGVKKINPRTIWKPSLGNFISLAILVLFSVSLGIFGYRQFSREVRLTQAVFPDTPTTPNRQLSFQGRLETAGGTPIEAATDFVFKLYDDAGTGYPPTGGTELYSSGACTTDPDLDGVFSVQIGDGTCGAGIGADVFTENQDVWLEVTVGTGPGEVLGPRQQIATVAYALNSETLQGFPISSTISAIRNTVVPMNQWGEIIVGETSPRLKGVSGTFQISAPSLSLITATGSNGNITLAPDGTGQVNLNGNTTSTNFFNVSNAQLTTGSLITGTASNNNTGFKLIDLLSGSSPTSKFSVTDTGLTTVGADLYVSSGVSLYNNAVSDDTFEATKFCTGDGETNCVTDFSVLSSGASIWTDAGAYIHPTSGEVLGNSASAGANKIAGLYLADSAPLVFGTDNDITFTFSGSELGVTQGNNDINFDANTLFVDGSASYVGIGTNTPDAKLDIVGANTEATYGTTLLSNGDFASGDFTSWTAGAGWSVVSNAALHTAGNTATLAQNISVTNGTYYQIEWTESGASAGSYTFSIGAVSSRSYVWWEEAAAKRTALVAPGTGSQAFSITPSTDYNGSLDNFTVRAISGWPASTVIVNNSDGTDGLQIRAGGTGRYNSFVGVGSGATNTTGFNNSGFGYNALNGNTTGYSNTAIGLNSLVSNRTGFSNSAVGAITLYANTIGVYNVAQGVGSMFSSSSGSYNVSIGTYSLLNNTTGTRNTAVGNEAGAYISGWGANQTSTNSVYIGAYSMALVNGDTNEIVIGDSAVGLGSNTVVLGNNSITLTALKGDVYISDGLSLYETAVSDGTVEATKFCTGDGETNCVTDFSSLGGASLWADGGAYIYPTSGEVLGNSASAGANKIAGIYLADSSPLVIGTDNDITLSFSGSELGVTQGNNDINFDANTLFVDGSADRVGIGTTTPGSKLEIKQAVASGISDSLRLTAGVSDPLGTGNAITFYGSVNDSVGTYNSGKIYSTFDANGYQYGRLTLVSYDNIGTALNTLNLKNGAVGIGTIAPDARLEINHATGDNMRLTYNDADGGATAYTDFSLAADGDLTIDSAGGAINFSDILNFGGGTSYYVDASGNAKFLDLIVADTGNPGLTVGNGSIGFVRIGGSTISDNNGDLTLDSDSNLLSSPDSASISGTLTIGDGTTNILRSAYGPLSLAYKSGLDTWATGLTLQDSTGYIGIGTTSPTVPLTVETNTGIRVGSLAKNISLFTSGAGNDINSTHTLHLNYSNNQDVSIGEGSNSDLFVSGSVGIGDTSPDGRLDVEGSAANILITATGGTDAHLTIYDSTTRTADLWWDQDLGNLVLENQVSGKPIVLNTNNGQWNFYNESNTTTVFKIGVDGKMFDTSVTAGVALGDASNTALSGFGAASLVGALNELKNVDKNTSHNDYKSWADHYQAKAEGTDSNSNESLNGLFFDTFADSTKFDAVNSTSSATIRVSDDSHHVGIMGGQTYNSSTADNDGQTYLGSNSVTDMSYYDRGRDSSPEVLVELGIDPNWYNGVTLTVATTSAELSQNSTVPYDKNPNLTTNYNGSLIKATGTDTGARSIFLTIKSPTTFDWTNYAGDAATGVTITPGTAQTLGVTGVSVTFTSVAYNVGDVFRIASWYIEAEGGSRGAKQPFPERATIVATASSVDIIDADTQKLWIAFDQNAGGYMIGIDTNNDPSAVKFLNGHLYVSENGSAATGLYTLDFVRDSAYNQDATDYSLSNQPISQRNAANTYNAVNTSQAIVTATANDVDAAVIPDQPTQEVTVSGWGYMTEPSANVGFSESETVLLPYTFANIPKISVTRVGYPPSTTNPNNLAECNGGGVTTVMDISTSSTTNNSFIIGLIQSGVGNWQNWEICYTWTATGTVSPKQFVAVATGATSADGGTTVFNETNGSKINVEVGSQHANALWQTKTALTDNTVYVASNDATDNVTTLAIYYGLHGLQSEASWAQYRNGYYSVRSQTIGSWSVTGPVISGSATGTNQITSLYVTPSTSTADQTSNSIYVGTASGVSIIQEYQGHGNVTDSNQEYQGSVKYYTKDYVSEQMIGDVRGMWPLDNALAAADFEDASIKANTLTGVNVTNAGDTVSGVRGNATDLDGSSEYFTRVHTSLDTADTTPLTLGAWIYLRSGGDNVIIDKGQATGFRYTLAVNSSSQAVFSVTRQSVAGYSATGTTTLQTNKWYHLVGTFHESTNLAKIYVNGQAEGSVTYATSGAAATAGTLTIGADYIGGTGLDGYIDEVFVTAHTVTPGQIRQMYEVGYRALQSHGTGLGAGAADSNQRLQFASTGTNTVGVAQPDWNNQYMYVGLNSTTLGGLTKIQLNSDTAIKKYIASGNTPSGGTSILDEDVNALSVGYQLESVGSASSGVKSMAPDNNSNALTGSLFSKTQTLASSTKFAYLWANVATDSSDAASAINVYACNNYATKALCDSNSAWVLGTGIQVDSNQSPPEREYSFAFPNTGAYMTFKINFSRTSTKTNTYLTRYGATWGSSVGGADLAERYQSTEPVYPGDILTIASPVEDGQASVSLAPQPYEPKLIGVVTTNPGIVMDENLVDLNFNAASRNSPNRPAVALAGRAPVKVSTANGPILVGDPLTSSSIPGIGMKATQAGTIIGRALEAFTCPPLDPTATPSATTTQSPVCFGTVMTFVNVGHHEPIFYLSDLGDFIFSHNHSASDSVLAHQPFQLVRVLTDGAQEVVERIGTFGSLVAANIKGQTLTIDTISPLASGSAVTVTAPIVIHPESDFTPALIVEGEIIATTISARMAQLDTLEVKNIVADHITANSIVGLDAKIATLTAGTTTSLSDQELTTITDRIKSRLSNLTGESPSAADIPLPPEATASALTSYTVAQWQNDSATTSATLASADIDFVTINQFLAVIGQATITTLAVTDTLTVQAIQSPAVLALQPLGGTVNLAANTLIVDSTGLVMVNGNLSVSGQLTAQTLSAIEGLTLGSPATSEAEGGVGSMLGQLLAVYDESGTQVASIDASGSANLASVSTKLITIAAAGAATPSSVLAAAATSNATAGNSTLVSPNTELAIISPYITPNSLVYLTPTGNPENKVLFVKSKKVCASPESGISNLESPCTPSFTVAIDSPASSDIPFNWWIIQIQTNDHD